MFVAVCSVDVGVIVCGIGSDMEKIKEVVYCVWI